MTFSYQLIDFFRRISWEKAAAGFGSGSGGAGSAARSLNYWNSDLKSC